MTGEAETDPGEHAIDARSCLRRGYAGVCKRGDHVVESTGKCWRPSNCDARPCRMVDERRGATMVTVDGLWGGGNS